MQPLEFEVEAISRMGSLASRALDLSSAFSRAHREEFSPWLSIALPTPHSGIGEEAADLHVKYSALNQVC